MEVWQRKSGDRWVPSLPSTPWHQLGRAWSSRARTRFQHIGSAGLRESHPHDVTITKEAPNCRIR